MKVKPIMSRSLTAKTKAAHKLMKAPLILYDLHRYLEYTKDDFSLAKRISSRKGVAFISGRSF